MNYANTTLFLLDNVDSFTYNLVDELRMMGVKIKIYRNTVALNVITQEMKTTSGQVVLLLSPGPGAPSEAGCMPQLLEFAVGRYPILGICLGHQGIVEHFAGIIGRSGQVVHGKSSNIEHCGKLMFSDIQNPLPVARYHSLMATNVPDCLEILAHYNDIPMAVYHSQYQVLGFQFHPESILTTQGSQLLKQSIDFLISRGDI